MKVITNNSIRELVTIEDLTEKERNDFEYVKDTEYLDERFFRYKGNVYDVNDAQYFNNSVVQAEFKEWDGVFSETFFSGVVFKYVYPTDAESGVIVGRYST